MTTPPARSTLPSSSALSTASLRGQRWPRHTARVDYRLSTPSVVVISVRGDIDASNTAILTDEVSEHATRCDGLVLDLVGLNFFGAEGFPALHRVSVSCARTGIGWALVAGAAVSRLLRICDPQDLLPAVGTVEGAVAIATSACLEMPTGAMMNTAAHSLGGGKWVPRTPGNAVSARPGVG